MDKTQLLQSLKQEEFSKEILNAFSKVRRENFLSDELKYYAYDNAPLPIGHGQTISQPYTIATALSLLKLKKSQKVLEVGSGCGYVLALISEIIGKSGKVFGIEIIKELAKNSKQYLKKYNNIQVYNRNGALGLKDKAPFDRILVSAACEKIPEKLLHQLKNNGIIVAPVGPRYEQSLVVMKKIKGKLVIKKKIPGFIFVPFIE